MVLEHCSKSSQWAYAAYKVSGTTSSFPLHYWSVLWTKCDVLKEKGQYHACPIGSIKTVYAENARELTGSFATNCTQFTCIHGFER